MRIRYIVNQTHPNGVHEVDGQFYSDKKANKFMQWLVAQCGQLKQENEQLKARLVLSENSLNNALKKLGV